MPERNDDVEGYSSGNSKNDDVVKAKYDNRKKIIISFVVGCLTLVIAPIVVYEYQKYRESTIQVKIKNTTKTPVNQQNNEAKKELKGYIPYSPKGSIREASEEGNYRNDGYINSFGVKLADLSIELGKNGGKIEKIELIDSNQKIITTSVKDKVILTPNYTINNIDMSSLSDGEITILFYGEDDAGNKANGIFLDRIFKDTIVSADAAVNGSSDLGDKDFYYIQNYLTSEENISYQLEAEGSFTDAGGSTIPIDLVNITWANVRGTNDLGNNDQTPEGIKNGKYHASSNIDIVGDISNGEKSLQYWNIRHGYYSKLNKREYIVRITLVDDRGNVKYEQAQSIMIE